VGEARGRYSLEHRLGRGAMGEVWLGRHLDTDALAAVKLVRQGARAQARQFFGKEGRTIALLNHPHIVPLFEIGADYLVTAYADGGDLQRRLHTPLPAAEAVRLTLQVAAALEHAHARGVVHRDVKPGNILLDRRGNAFLGDFGLAVIAGEGSESAAGTPQYMAPEQHGGVATPASDQYALGRTLMEMLVGERVPVDRFAALAMVPPSVPSDLRAILDRATAASAEERFADVRELAAALVAVDVSGLGAPERLAREVRVAAPFHWCSGAERKDAIAVDIVRADYRLSDLEARGLLDREACARFRARTGQSDVAFTLYGREGRIGSLTSSSALARATELVVLLHGWACDREVWSTIAAGVCRDAAQTIVLCPDVLGFGGSPYAGTPDGQTVPPGMARATLAWLELLGLRELPTVLVGHSMAGMHLLGARDDELGPRTTRVVISPALTLLSRPYRLWLWLLTSCVWLMWLLPPLRGLIAKMAVGQLRMLDEATEEQRDQMTRALFSMPITTLLKVTLGSTWMRIPDPGQLRGCVMMIGGGDPVATPAMAKMAMRRLQLSPAQLRWLATGGHYPHIPSAAHPEHTARNAAQIVALIDDMLVAAQDGSVSSTKVASTVGS
jgi:serine/threonine-protein kinase